MASTTSNSSAVPMIRSALVARRSTGLLGLVFGLLVMVAADRVFASEVDKSEGDFANVEASVSPDASKATLRRSPVPLARDASTGVLMMRSPDARRGTQDCRWPDERTLAAVVPVATDHGSHASGVVIAQNRVLTAAHAIAEGGRLFARIDEDYRAADLVMMDPESDIAILAVNTGVIVPLAISKHDPIDRQQVWAVGFPREAGRTTTSGVFQRNREGALHSSASIDSGQSGGGLLTCEHGDFQVQGMLRGFGAYRNGSRYEKLENHSVSVAGTTIHRVLAERF